MCCAVVTTAGVIFARSLTRAAPEPQSRSFLRHRCEDARREREGRGSKRGGGFVSLFPFCPLNPVVPVQRTCVSVPREDVRGSVERGSQTGDKAAARLADSDSLSRYWCMCCLCVCVVFH